MYPYRVDPKNIPQRLSNPQLEYFILFAILVAGKSADQTYKKLNEFLERVSESIPFDLSYTPFELIRFLIGTGELLLELEASRFGQYTRVTPAIRKAIELDLDSLTIDKLEEVPGIGPKTARYILLYADPSFQGVPLDTHILKYLNARGYAAVPRSTPSSEPTYNRLERLFQKEAADLGKTVRELDTEVWKRYAVGEARRVA